ncbi:MAG TPA: alanine--tRNA ligase [bacterium]|nr:MAG: Alanine--tRNA ligase [Parcubacteria group bacterium ADurb.Bin192]HPN15130.1 alanine--tRNA ligase [bacterium]
MHKNLTTDNIRRLFLDFFKEKGHAVLPSASLIPENDPTVLFTTAGMQPLVPYLLGQDHPMGKRLANAQKCLRTDDIDEVGDNRHLTFFEMLGNWSLGDYFKEESIQWSYELLTNEKWLAMDPERLYVSVFEGDADAPRDDDSINMWQAQFAVHGMAAEVGQPGIDWPTGETHGKRIFPYPKKNNWWGPAGQTGPCGPDTEIYYDTRREHDPAFGDICHPACDCGRFVEIWNNVFMQYNKRDDGSYEPLAQRNVDTGMGLERMAAVLQGCATVFDTDKMQNIIQVLKQVFGLDYGQTDDQDKAIRIIADHLRAVVFLIGDVRGVVPSNIGQGYIVRRLIRRSVREAKRLGVEVLITPAVCQAVIEQYKDEYTELEQNAAKILNEVKKEEEKFNLTLEKGLKEFDKMAEQAPKISGEQAFVLYATYGFPIELTEELAKERGGSVDRGVFEEEFKKHQALSRTASAGTFKGGLADHTEQTTKLHTATHLLHQALRSVLGTHVEQRGSNITEQRLRFDFTHGQKMTDQEKDQVEAMVNAIIKRDLPVIKEEMSVEQAKEKGAIGLFESKYGEKVSVYTVLDTENPAGYYSKEICGGPHVARTGELGGFKISKEEAVSAGVRRIKAVLG